MKRLTTIALLAAAIAVTGCGKKSDKTENKPAAGAPSDAEFEGLMNKFVGMFDAMGAAVDAAGDDCGKLAEGLGKVMDDNKDFMESAKKWKGNAEMDKKAEEWMKGHMDKMMPTMMKIGTAGQKCASDAKFAEVMKRFDELK